jgi:hypothetical protein
MDKGMEPSNRGTKAPIPLMRTAEFWVFLFLALTIFAINSVDAFVNSPLGDACWVVSVDKYWIREFSDMPGVKAYAESMLKYDEQDLLMWTMVAFIPPFYPFFYILPAVGLFVTTALAAHRKERWKYAAIVYVLLSLFSLCVSPFFFPK